MLEVRKIRIAVASAFSKAGVSSLFAVFKPRLAVAFGFSLVLHGIIFKLHPPIEPKPTNSPTSFTVVLVNAKSKSRPEKADALAQANLDGGGNTDQEHRAKSPLPILNDAQQFTPEQMKQRVAQLEEESKKLLTQLKSSHQIAHPETIKQPADTGKNVDLVEQSLEIMRLEAQISKNWNAYQERPRRKFIGARTQEYRLAQYIEDWRLKVERFGNLNYPAVLKQKQIFGSLRISVSINADGTLENVEVNSSSGNRLLDAAALRIVRLAAPYAPLPPDIRKDMDIMGITRTMTFTSADKLESE